MFLIEQQREAILKTVLGDHPRAFCTGFVHPRQWDRIKDNKIGSWRLAVLTTNQDGRPDRVFLLTERWPVMCWIERGVIGSDQLKAVPTAMAALQVAIWLQYRHIEEVAVSPAWCLGMPSSITALVEAEARVQRAREETQKRYGPKRVAYGRS